MFKAIVEDVNPPKYAPRPLVADLDGDGQQDLLARADSGEIVALWSRAGGASTRPRSSPRSPARATRSARASPWRCSTPTPTSRSRSPWPAPGGSSSTTSTPARGRFAASRTTFPGPPPEAGSDFVALVAGDVDGDGVDDLAVAMSSCVPEGVPRQAGAAMRDAARPFRPLLLWASLSLAAAPAVAQADARADARAGGAGGELLQRRRAGLRCGPVPGCRGGVPGGSRARCEPVAPVLGGAGLPAAVPHGAVAGRAAPRDRPLPQYLRQDPKATRREEAVTALGSLVPLEARIAGEGAEGGGGEGATASSSGTAAAARPAAGGDAALAVVAGRGGAGVSGWPAVRRGAARGCRSGPHRVRVQATGRTTKSSRS